MDWRNYWKISTKIIRYSAKRTASKLNSRCSLTGFWFHDLLKDSVDYLRLHIWCREFMQWAICGSILEQVGSFNDGKNSVQHQCCYLFVKIDMAFSGQCYVATVRRFPLTLLLNLLTEVQLFVPRSYKHILLLNFHSKLFTDSTADILVPRSVLQQKKRWSHRNETFNEVQEHIICNPHRWTMRERVQVLKVFIRTWQVGFFVSFVLFSLLNLPKFAKRFGIHAKLY